VFLHSFWVSSFHSRILLQATLALLLVVKVKVMFSHTRYRAFGPELIPVYRPSARRWLEAIHPAVGCHYFPPCLLPSQPKSVTAHRPVPNYTAWWQRHMRVSSLTFPYFLQRSPMTCPLFNLVRNSVVHSPSSIIMDPRYGNVSTMLQLLIVNVYAGRYAVARH